jgi:cytochrome c oxidase assembly factor CtaG
MHLSAEAFGLVPLLAFAYVLATRRLRPDRARATAAVAALALIFLAFATALQGLALHTFLWAHLLQNVVLAEWAPGLLVLAVPPALAARARGFALFDPFVALPVWIATYLLWHLPWVYDYALRRPHSLLHVEHAMYLAAGLAVWWPVVHGRQSAGAKSAYLFAAFVLASPLGLLLALIPRPVYAFYEQAPRTWGPGPLVDQQIAGVTMAVEQAIVFFAVFAYYLLQFLRDEEASGALLTTSTAPEPRRAADGFARPRR